MYSSRDIRDANRRVKHDALLLAAVLAPMLAAYVLALVKGWYALTAALAVLMLVWCLLAGDLALAPHVRYARFLKEMQRGLRRSADCMLEETGEEAQVQDGVRVYSLQVRLTENGDSRIFYISAEKLDCLPGKGKPVRLVSYGRHVVDFLEI